MHLYLRRAVSCERTWQSIGMGTSRPNAQCSQCSAGLWSFPAQAFLTIPTCVYLLISGSSFLLILWKLLALEVHPLADCFMAQ